MRMHACGTYWKYFISGSCELGFLRGKKEWEFELHRRIIRIHIRQVLLPPGLFKWRGIPIRIVLVQSKVTLSTHSLFFSFFFFLFLSFSFFLSFFAFSLLRHPPAADRYPLQQFFQQFFFTFFHNLFDLFIYIYIIIFLFLIVHQLLNPSTTLACQILPSEASIRVPSNPRTASLNVLKLVQPASMIRGIVFISSCMHTGSPSLNSKAKDLHPVINHSVYTNCTGTQMIPVKEIRERKEKKRKRKDKNNWRKLPWNIKPIHVCSDRVLNHLIPLKYGFKGGRPKRLKEKTHLKKKY